MHTLTFANLSNYSPCLILCSHNNNNVYLIYENTTVVIMVFCGLFFHCAFQKDMIDVVERSKSQMIIKDYTLNHKQGLQYYHQLSTIKWYCSKTN